MFSVLGTVSQLCLISFFPYGLYPFIMLLNVVPSRLMHLKLVVYVVSRIDLIRGAGGYPEVD